MSLLQSQRYIFQYFSQCFGLRFEFQQWQSVTRSDREFRFAVTLKNIGLDATDAVFALGEALSDEDIEVRKDAMRALEVMGPAATNAAPPAQVPAPQAPVQAPPVQAPRQEADKAPAVRNEAPPPVSAAPAARSAEAPSASRQEPSD